MTKSKGLEFPDEAILKELNILIDCGRYDPFTFMRENKKKYGFVMTLPEYQITIETLWPATQEFIKANPQYLAPNNSLGFIVDESKGYVLNRFSGYTRYY